MMDETLSIDSLHRQNAETVEPESFETKRHYYPRVLNAQIHDLVAHFLRLTPQQLVARYCHLNPQVDRDALLSLIRTRTRHLHWAGADLFYTVSENGVRRMVVIETNSCPSGNKSMPLLSEEEEQGGYKRVLSRCFMPLLKRRQLAAGGLAVVYDKNYTEASGYAAALADLASESVFLAPFPDGAADPPVRIQNESLLIRDDSGQWRPIRAAFRYVTQRPWNRFPIRSRSAVCNPIIGCLAGGRNKLMASKAYELFNAELAGTGLTIRSPETIRDVSLAEVPLWVERFGGYAVVKNPYSNAGRGVWTITNNKDLARLMEAEHDYDRFIVQGLVGNASWTSSQQGSRYYHVGTVPTRKGHIYVADLRMMVASGEQGFSPISIYARRAREPLPTTLGDTPSWDVLGTNLSVRSKDGGWLADTQRLVLMDRRDFNRLGLGPDDLLDAYVQTVLSTVAIDKMAARLLTKRGTLRRRLFRSLDDDAALMAEIMAAVAPAAPTSGAGAATSDKGVDAPASGAGAATSDKGVDAPTSGAGA